LGLNIGEISGKFWGIGPQMVPWKKVPNYVYWVHKDFLQVFWNFY